MGETIDKKLKIQMEDLVENHKAFSACKKKGDRHMTSDRLKEHLNQFKDPCHIVVLKLVDTLKLPETKNKTNKLDERSNPTPKPLPPGLHPLMHEDAMEKAKDSVIMRK